MRKCGTGLRIGLLLLSVLFFTGGRRVQAAEEAYTYTVRLYAGNQGSLTGEGIEVDSDTARVRAEGDQMVITGLQYGDLVAIHPQEAAASTDERYYVRGVRRSGRDNTEAEAPAFYVGSDRDFVVAYGVSGDLVSYTVEYVDGTGKEILERDTYYGNVGERQYVSSRYVDGYQPRELNLVRTLSPNEAENVFSFAYDPVQSVVVPETAPSPSEEGEGGEEEAGQLIDDEEVPLGGDANVRPEANREEEGGRQTVDEEDGRQIGDEEVPLAGGQKFLKDIDDEEVPLGTYKDERKNTVLGYLPVYVGTGSAAVAALLVAALFLRKRQRSVEAESPEGTKGGRKRSGHRKKGS